MFSKAAAFFMVVSMVLYSFVENPFAVARYAAWLSAILVFIPEKSFTDVFRVSKHDVLMALSGVFIVSLMLHAELSRKICTAG